MSGMLACFNCAGEIHIVVGGGSNISSFKISKILESGARAILFSLSDNDRVSRTFEAQIAAGTFTVVERQFELTDLTSWGRDEVDGVVDKVFVSLPMSQYELKKDIFQACCRKRIPVNTSDSPELSTFTLLSSYKTGDFQMGVTTLGKGCKLASRIKREITNMLPSNIGQVCSKVGELRQRIQEEDQAELSRMQQELEEIGEHDDDAVTTSKLNSLVQEFDMTKEDMKTQRARWLSQIVEYFPLKALADISIEDLSSAYRDFNLNPEEAAFALKKHEPKDKGSISLVGAGPGSVSLLTLGALNEIHSADLVLADKLVPQEVLDIVPKHGTRLFIARKFPGNAEKAQQELLALGMEGLSQGEKVVRLKQGDPCIFGRGGEEYNYFREQGYTPLIFPGITSALAAPVLNNIPITHREVADQVLICTGTGRRGALPNLPDYVESRTTVFLMALHRIVELIPKLIDDKKWDPSVPAAIIERASCPDQRIIRTKLENVAQAVAACGSRPPGLLVTGFACNVTLTFSGPEKWVVEEGCEILPNSFLEPYMTLAESVRSNKLALTELQTPPIDPVTEVC